MEILLLPLQRAGNRTVNATFSLLRLNLTFEFDNDTGLGPLKNFILFFFYFICIVHRQREQRQKWHIHPTTPGKPKINITMSTFLNNEEDMLCLEKIIFSNLVPTTHRKYGNFS